MTTINGISGRDFISSCGKAIYIELTGTRQTGFTPRFAAGTNPKEVETCCTECGAELAETMTYTLSDDDTKRYIECGACGNKYRIRLATMFCVTARIGFSFEHIAVEALDLQTAERKAQDAGYKLSGATSYPIDAYGARFCHKVIQ